MSDKNMKKVLHDRIIMGLNDPEEAVKWAGHALAYIKHNPQDFEEDGYTLAMPTNGVLSKFKQRPTHLS